MEFKKKTIIGEDNNEPPKDYIGAKKDGKFYEYSYATRSWIESKLIKAEESGGSDEGGSSVDINTILDNISIKDDLLTKLRAIDYTNQDPVEGVSTDLTFDDIFNDYDNFIEKIINREDFKNIIAIQFYNDITVNRIEGEYTWNIDIYDNTDSTGYLVYIYKEEIRVYKQSSNPK